MTILEKIEQNAKNNPKRIAYIENGIKDGSVFQNVLTWKELSENSGVLANYLETHLKTKKPVVVYGHKSILMPICFLACAKSGRAYVPIDITVPASRVEDIINAVDPELVILTEDYESSFENIFETDKILSIINNEKEIISPAKWIEKDSVFYIIFTSGSTGKPKGVQITRDCLDNFIVWGITLFNYNEIQENGGVFINQAPFSFDLSVMDLYLSLYSGGTEFAISKKLLFETNILFDLFNKSEGVIWVSTPSFADVCLADKKFCQNLLPKLKTFLFCGETLSNRTAGKLLNLFPKAKVINTYGPTESTVAVTGVNVTTELNENRIPLPVGKTKQGTWILICNSEGKLVTDGEPGEIVIVGDSVSIGYWNNEEKTRNAFSIYNIDGVDYRSYRTGDKGYIKDGMLYYCGRIDLQIKLHGYRIEIEDIENNLLKLPDVQKAAVVPNYRENGEVRSITAYLILKNNVPETPELVQIIRKQLGEYIPEYMIPKKIRILETLPMTANGKVDRKALGGVR